MVVGSLSDSEWLCVCSGDLIPAGLAPAVV